MDRPRVPAHALIDGQDGHGYYLEVSKANLEKVPEDHHRKQTLAGAERFITPELKEMEGKILGARDRSLALELELFGALRQRVADEVEALRQTARASGAADALQSLLPSRPRTRTCARASTRAATS